MKGKVNLGRIWTQNVRNMKPYEIAGKLLIWCANNSDSSPSLTATSITRKSSAKLRDNGVRRSMRTFIELALFSSSVFFHMRHFVFILFFHSMNSVCLILRFPVPIHVFLCLLRFYSLPFYELSVSCASCIHTSLSESHSRSFIYHNHLRNVRFWKALRTPIVVDE